jgi:glutamine amidotransferase
MKRKVTIIDYGMGNLLSVANAFEYCRADVHVSDKPSQIIDANLLVLPGVGAFADAMGELKKKSLDQAILEFSLKQRPFLGICLGMQMMLCWSKEFGHHKGLGFIDGTVEPIEHTDIHGIPHKVPHIGWTGIVPQEGSRGWNNTLLENTQPNTSFYFVHSYTAVPTSDENRLADGYYNGRLISSVIQKDLMYGCQFHPEKSGENGLKLLETFLNL